MSLPQQDRISIWHTVRGRLTIILMLALLPVMTFSMAEAAREMLLAKRQNRADLEQLARVLTDEYKLVFNGAFQVLAVLQHQTEIENPRTADCAITLERALAGSFDFSDISVIDASGAVICSSAKLGVPADFARSDWFQLIQAPRKSVVSAPLKSPVTGQTVIIAAVPLETQGTPAKGAVAVSIFGGMLERIRRLAEIPPEVGFNLVSADSSVMLSASSEQGGFRLSKAELAAALKAKAAIEIKNGRGERLDCVVIPIVEGDLYGVVFRPATFLTSSQIVSIASQVILPITLTAFALFIVWLATERNVVRWVRHLRALAIAYRRGNMKVRAKDMDAAPRELAQLGATMEQMADAITDREARLVENLAQREALLRELNHRVKNNLQIISSLLNLQARSVSSVQEEMIVRELQARIDAIALVHRGVSGMNQPELIDLRELLPQLAEQLARYYSRPEKQVSISTKSEEVLLTIDDAVPLAQLVTEAVTNSYKHAFPSGQPGEVRISLVVENEMARLEIADNGVGLLPGETPSAARRRMGHALIFALAHQIGGSAQITSQEGTKIIVGFAYRQAQHRGGAA